MTRNNAIQEIVIMTLLLGLVAVVFLETTGNPPAPAKQLAPSAFPRIAAGVIGALACLRVLLIVVARSGRRSTHIWPLRSFVLPAVLSAMMIAYFLLFDRVPFVVLTAAFLALGYGVMGVRPVGRIVLAAAVGAGLLYLLFAQILSIAV